MCSYSLTHVPDPVLLRGLATLVSRERGTTAEVLAYLAEVDERKLYLPAAHPSMFSYCVHELHFPEDAAYKRIQAARTARRFPALFPAVAQGRLHLSAVCLLAPHLTRENADQLLAAAGYKTKAEIEALLAQRFPRPDLPPRVRALPTQPCLPEARLAPGQVVIDTPGSAGAPGAQLAPGQVESPAPLPPVASPALARMEAPGPRPRVAPLAPRRFARQMTIGQSTHDKLRHVQALLGHEIPPGDLAQVLDRALDALIAQLERRRFAAATRPARGGQRGTPPRGRHIPAAVKRAVWERDGAAARS